LNIDSASGRHHFGSHIVADVCKHNPAIVNNCERVTEDHYCLMLLQQYGLVLVNLYTVEF